VVWHNSFTLCIVLVYQGLRCTYMHLPWRLKQCAFCLSLCCRCKQRSAEEECVEVIVASWMMDDVFLWSDHDSSTGAQQSVRPRCFLYFSPSWPSAASSFHTPCTLFCCGPGRQRSAHNQQKRRKRGLQCVVCFFRLNKVTISLHILNPEINYKFSL